MAYSECLLLSDVLLLLLCCLLLLLLLCCLLLLLLRQHLVGPQAWMAALGCHVIHAVHEGSLLKGLVGKPDDYRGGKKKVSGQVVKFELTAPCQ